jgi:hypothetical protein
MAMTGKQFEIELTGLRCVAAEWSKKKLMPDFMRQVAFGGTILKK